ncbi:hypothetical protein LSH36_178g03037 [Paralvinella palmiformis]|uniref:Uncharacterized protein n=1 Tax=Paralvinella palmiformis TaxID=53620 RepID=A0AAD9JRI4_9ANNE|nr:hypothetical protein LSH36_178g03037 [Paralvinella palmiformis]
MSQNANYNTIDGTPSGRSGMFRLIMPPAVMMMPGDGTGQQTQQVIRIGPSGVCRSVTPTGGGLPQVRVLERQSSGQFRVVGGTPCGSQVIRVPGQGAGTYRIRVVTGDENESSPSLSGERIFYQSPSTPPIVSSTSTSYTMPQRLSRFDASTEDGHQYPGRIHLASVGRSSSADNLGTRFVISSSPGPTTPYCSTTPGGVPFHGATPSSPSSCSTPHGTTIYSTGPRGMSFSISSAEVQPTEVVNQTEQQQPEQQQLPEQQQIIYGTDESSQARRSSSPQIRVIRFHDPSDSRRRHPGSFDDIIQRKLSNFLMGRGPQYLFRHQPTVQPQTDPARNEYIIVSRPQQSGQAERRGSLDSSSPSIVPGKKIVRTTREEIRNIGDGQTQTIREVNEELVDDDGKASQVRPDVIPVYSTPAVGSEDFDTWKSTGSNDSGSGSGSADRNIFNRFRFKFNSIGNFGHSDSRESTASKEALRFEDFDDMVGHISQLKVPVLKAVSTPTTNTNAICPYCKSENPEAISDPSRFNFPSDSFCCHGNTNGSSPSSGTVPILGRDAANVSVSGFDEQIFANYVECFVVRKDDNVVINSCDDCYFSC